MAKATGTFTLSGVDELNRVFKQLPKKLGEKAVLNAVRAGARTVRDEARRLVPVKTGQLRKDIKVITEKKSRRTAEKLVSVGVKGPSAFRAHFIEFGTRNFPARPFLRPAAANKAEEAIRIMTTQLGVQVEKQAASLIAKEGAGRKRR